VLVHVHLYIMTLPYLTYKNLLSARLIVPYSVSWLWYILSSSTSLWWLLDK